MTDDSRTFDIDRLEAEIIAKVLPIVREDITDRMLERVSLTIHNVLVEDYKNLLKPTLGQSRHMRVQAMKRAVIRYGGNCRTCISYDKENPHLCKPSDPEVLGCSHYKPRRRNYAKKATPV